MRLLQLPDYVRAYFAQRHDPEWREMLRLFWYHAGTIAAVQRLSRVWIENHRLQPINIYSGTILEEWWNGERIGELVDEMAAISHRSGVRNGMKTDAPPRFTDHPLVIVRTQGKEFFIDGRRRANVWRHDPGPFPVRIIEVLPKRNRFGRTRPIGMNSPKR